MYDASGAETTDSASATQALYTITVLKMMSKPSFNTVMAAPTATRTTAKTTATISVTSPPLG